MNFLEQFGKNRQFITSNSLWPGAIDASVFTSNRRLEMGMANGCLTQEDAKKDIVDYIEMLYNSSRAHSYLGHLSPNEYERVQQTLPMAA